MSVAQDLALRGAPRIMTSLVHDIATVRGVERQRDQILRRTSVGRVGKRSNAAVAVDIACVDVA